MTVWQLFMKASRFQVLPVMVIPVFLGGGAAFAWNHTFHPLRFLITLIGAGAAHLFSNMINDLWDYRNGVDQVSKETAAAISTNSGFLTKGIMTLRTFAALTWMLLVLAAGCGVALSFAVGWWALLLGALGGALAYFYVAPPVKFGYRGKGYSEIAILFSFGILPVMGSYYVQTGTLDLRAALLSLPVGLLTTLILFNHHFLHWQADEQAGKKTLVVVWGEGKALRFSRVLLGLAYASLLVCAAARIVPYYTIVAAVTAIPVIKVYSRLDTHNASHAYLPLMGASLKASVRCGVLMIAALVIHGFLH